MYSPYSPISYSSSLSSEKTPATPAKKTASRIPDKDAHYRPEIAFAIFAKKYSFINGDFFLVSISNECDIVVQKDDYKVLGTTTSFVNDRKIMVIRTYITGRESLSIAKLGFSEHKNVIYDEKLAKDTERSIKILYDDVPEDRYFICTGERYSFNPSCKPGIFVPLYESHISSFNPLNNFIAPSMSEISYLKLPGAQPPVRVSPDAKFLGLQPFVKADVKPAAKSAVKSKTSEDKKFKGEYSTNKKGKTILMNELIPGCCSRKVERGPNPRKHCNSPIFKQGRCSYHHQKYRKENPFLF